MNWVFELVLCGYKLLADFLFAFSADKQELLAIILAPFLKLKKVFYVNTFTIVDDKPHVVLVSGSLFPFVINHMERYQLHRTLCVVDSHYEGRLRNGRPTCTNPSESQRVLALINSSWHRFRHVSVGGATNFISLFARTHVSALPKVSKLERGIKHFLNAGVQAGPPPKDLPFLRHGLYYMPADRLIPSLYHLPVLVDSYFHMTGKGYRSLRIDELASIHGFPRQQIFANFPRSILDMPPCQLLSASLDVVWVPEVPLSPVLDTNPCPAKRPEEIETYLPKLKRFLSHDWVDTSIITAKALKADDAASPCRLWDARLELLFPGVTPYLETLRRAILGWIRRRLWREIRVYLSCTFNQDWALELYRLRRQALLLGPQRGLLGGGALFLIQKNLIVVILQQLLMMLPNQ